MKLETKEQINDFLYTLVRVVPVAQLPTTVCIPNLLQLYGAPTMEFYGPAGKIALVDEDTYRLEQKYEDRLSRLERQVGNLKKADQ